MSFKKAKQAILGSYLEYKRILAGLSRGEVAEKLGHSTAQFVADWERGVGLPPFDHFPQLAKLYSLSTDEFVAVILKDQEVALRQLFAKRTPAHGGRRLKKKR